MNPFREQINTALSNPALQSALDANALKRLLARQKAYASLPEPLDVLRERAHRMRAETIQNLDSYLGQFAAKVKENGIILHWAADAQEAAQIVVSIANEKNAQLIAKSKTMVSEEIGLNKALEASGIQPIETDLGEYIVQLRGEPPAHINTPAVHLRRQEVGQTFHEKLGTPLTTDINVLTDAARKTLRQTFLDADIGITGVNFGVAESGSLCIVTNEGNARMVTTLPPVHIALMGMERLVPTFDDLELMLALLPRSAAGQKITVYNQLIHAPRRADEIDGAQERHLIILDNGRSSIQGSPLNDALLCIRCGTCLNACPVFRELGGHAYVGEQGQHTIYPGPIGSVISPGLFGLETFGHLAQASTLCGACKDACPVDIDLPEMLLQIRSGMDLPTTRPGVGMPEGFSFGLKAYAWAASNSKRYGLAQKGAAVFSRILFPRKHWMRLPSITGWGHTKDFPRPAAKTFRERFDARRRDTETSEKKFGKALGDESSSPPKSDSTSNIVSPISRFEEQLELVGGRFTHCAPEALAVNISALLKERGINQIMAWEQGLLDKLLDELRELGIHTETTPHAELQAGLTGALAAIAETGTLVQVSGPGLPLSTSLLPRIHMAVLREEDIHENLSQIMNMRAIGKAGSVVLITGPSRTADIELTLTIGMHGPEEVHVFCV